MALAQQKQTDGISLVGLSQIKSISQLKANTMIILNQVSELFVCHWVNYGPLQLDSRLELSRSGWWCQFHLMFDLSRVIIPFFFCDV